jgi:predicted DNA-binding transcriptional regulator YafY
MHLRTMTRLDRLSAILILLQTKKVVRGQDIAERFNISLRTAYRDLRSLEEAGVPIYSEAGLGYSLMEGYRLPPVMFTQEEAMSFVTAHKLLKNLTDAQTFRHHQSALEKVKAVLRSEQKELIADVEDHMDVLESPFSQAKAPIPEDIFMQSILRAVSEKKVIIIDYFAAHSQEYTTRSVEPVGIFFMSHHWHLIAYCWLRKDYRQFRLDRISQINTTEITFTKKHPALKVYLKTLQKESKDLTKVVIQIQNDIYRFIEDQKYYHGFVSEKRYPIYTEMTFLTSSVEGFARWYIMFGDKANIISGPVRKTVIKLAKTILVKLTEKIY